MPMGVLRSRRDDTEPLRRWAQRVALRRGPKVGIVALARKLAGILYAMWRDGTTYEKREGRAVGETAAQEGSVGSSQSGSNTEER